LSVARLSSSNIAIWSGAHGGGEDARERSTGDPGWGVSLLLDNYTSLSVHCLIAGKAAHNLDEVAFTARTLNTTVCARPFMLALIAVDPLAFNPLWV
jgi:hypothetical protein